MTTETTIGGIEGEVAQLRAEYNEQVSRNDNIMNAFSGIGVTGVDRHESTTIGSGQVFNQEALDNYYHHSRFARRVIDRPAKDASRAGWKLTINGHELVDPLGPELTRLKSRKYFREAHRMARLTGGGAVIIIIDDKRELKEPVDRENIRKIRTLQYVDRFELIATAWYSDIEHPEYGKPRMYRLHPKSTASSAIEDREEVHADRVIRFEGLPVRRERESFYDGWGQPALEAAWTAMKDIDVTVQSMATTMHEFQFQVMKLKDLKALLSGPNGEPNATRFNQRMSMILLAKSMLKAVVLDADREELESRSVDFTGAVAVYSIMQQNLSAVTEMPLSLLFGQMPQGFASADETGQQNYRENVQGMQDEFYEPGLQKLGSYIILSHEGPFGKRSVKKREELTDGLRVEFNTLEKPDMIQQTQVREGLARADAAWIGAGVLQPSDSRRRFQENEFQVDIFVDPKRDVELKEFDEMKQAQLDLAANQGSPGPAPNQQPAKPPEAPEPSNPKALQQAKDSRFDAMVELFDLEMSTNGRAKLYEAAERRDEEPALTLVAHLAWEEQQRRDANDDPPKLRASRRKTQSRIEAGELAPASERKCVDCGAKADEYDHKDEENVEPVCASCHHKRTGARGDAFAGPNDPNLPDHVKRLPQQKKTQWVATFNKALDTQDEGEARKAANKAVE